MPTDYSALLNETQLEAVTTKDQHVRIIAGAGSGKTRVLTYRIAYLIEEMGTDPYSILAVTFTNKAANEMKERVAKLVGGAAHFLFVSTFHSFCARFLRSECRAIGYPASFVIYDEDDQNSIIKEVGVEMGYKKSDKQVKRFGEFIKRKKMLGKYPDDVVLTGHSADEDICLEAYRKYEERKTSMLALDFDDLILQTLHVLSNFPDIRDKWSSRFQHILVDEFQDTNDVQHKLICLLSNPSTNIYVVGDPDQTIYTWRGANQTIILDFTKEFPDATQIVLNRNYRSTNNILSAANKLIAHNKKRIPKDLYTEEPGGEEVAFRKFTADKAEASYVASRVMSLAGPMKNYSNIAILYRSSYMTRAFESEFASRGIPYRIFGGLRFYQRKEVKDCLAYFRLLLNPLDDVSFDRIANVPKRNVGETSMDRLKEEAREAGLSLYNYVLHIEEYPSTDVPTRVIVALTVLINKMEETKKKLNDNLEVYSSVLRDFITDLGYLDYLAKEEDIDEDRVGNVNSLFDDITYFISNNPDSTFEEYLQNVSLLTSQDDMNGGNYVSFMTIHVAKGLEFDNVFVISMNDGAFPNARAQSESGRDGLEEERRLAYVAMTRARKRLFLTCNTGYSYVTDTRGVESQFFKEAGFQFSRDDFSSFSSSYRPRESQPSYSYSKPESKKYSSFFDDGKAITGFDDGPIEKPTEKPKPALSDNGIKNWKVGDRIRHEAFGEGTVETIVSDKIFIVVFDSGTKKTMLSNHPMISRIKSSGGDA